VDTENPTLNANLHHNISRAKANSISVSLDAHVPHELTISAVDLSVIIGNTFDNAIEDCAAPADAGARISVSLVQQNKMLFYEIANSCMHAPPKKEGNLHGYGIGNVRRYVDKYDGTMENRIADDQYRISIRLNCP